jgi:peptide chain release factor 2
MADPGFWSNQEKAQATLAEVKSLRIWLDPYDKLTGRLNSAIELDELLQDGSEPEMDKELDAETARVHDEIDSFEVRSLLRGPDDFRDAQLEISAGAGGTEAQDWAQMLMRMYIRWAERRGFEVGVLDESAGEEAGIKGAVLEIRGHYAYGFLRPETGVHRLVRISPFDANARRHTSFASVFVYPMVNEEINIEIRGSHHAHSDQHGRRVAGGEVAVQEQGDRDEDAEEQALPGGSGKARRAQGGARCDEIGCELREPDQELRIPAVYDGQ